MLSDPDGTELCYLALEDASSAAASSAMANAFAGTRKVRALPFHFESDSNIHHEMMDTPIHFYSIGMYDNNVVMVLVMMTMVVVMGVLVDDYVWFVSDDDFVSPYHGPER